MSDQFKPKSFSVSQADHAPLPDQEEKRILDYFDEIYGEARKAKEPIKKIMESSYLSYKSILSDFTYQSRNIAKWGLAVFVPYTFQTIAGLEAQMTGKPPVYRLSPVRSPRDVKDAEFVTKVSLAEYKRAQAGRAMADATQLSLIFGTSFLRSHFKYDVRKKKFVKEVALNGKVTYEEREKEFYKGWAVDAINPLKVYLPKIREHESSKWPFYIERELEDVRRIKAYYEAHPELAYKNNYKFLEGGGDVTDDMAVYDRQDVLYRLPLNRYPGSAKDLMANMFPTSSEASQTNEHIIEKFRVFSEDTDEWFVIAGGRVVEYHPNPLEDLKELPVAVMRDYEVKNCPWGVGEPELIRWLQFEANAVHNLALDSTKYSVSPVFAMMSAYLQDEDEFEVIPGKVVRLKNVPGLTAGDAIQAINMPEVKGSIFKMLDMNETLVRQTTGAGSYVVGGNDQSAAGSATDANNLRAASSARVYDRARRIEQNTLTEVVRHQLAHMGQFYDDEMVVRVSNDEFYRIVPGSSDDFSPEQHDEIKNRAGNEAFAGVVFGGDLAKGYTASTEAESTLPITKSDKQTQAMQLLKIASETRRPFTEEELAANPNLPAQYPQGAPVLDAIKVTRELLLPTFSIVDNADEFLWSPDGQGPDRVRGVGRPPDPFKQMATTENVAETQLMSAAQPNNQANNFFERPSV